MSRYLTALGAAAVLALTAVPATAQDGPEFERRTDNVSFVAHVPYLQGTDMQFQRRTGPQILDGQRIEGTRDYLFAGSDASLATGEPPGEGEGIHVLDVTDPRNPVELAGIECTGYHSDVALYEDLLVHAIDSARTNTGCSPEFDPNGLDQPETAGVRIYDVTDPARPVVAGFVTEEELGGTVHNITTLPWAGLLYIAGSDFTRPDPRFAWVDLTDPEFPATVIPINDISPLATAECHDIGVAHRDDGDLAFCAAVEQTFIWDISDPRNPTEVSRIINPAINIHHGARLAPDGTTLVLNDELAGAAAAFGCFGTEQAGLVGALWFYDIADPSRPRPMGSFSTAEFDPSKDPCTSHFYNFIPGQELVVTGWYRSGIIVTDYSDPMQPTEHAAFLPAGGNFWSAYYWHGFIYGNSFEGFGSDEGGGIWVAQLDGVGDVEPSPFDMGLSWAPWTPPAEETQPAVDDVEEPAPSRDLPTTGGGAAAGAIGLGLAGLAALAARRRYR